MVKMRRRHRTLAKPMNQLLHPVRGYLFLHHETTVMVGHCGGLCLSYRGTDQKHCVTDIRRRQARPILNGYQAMLSRCTSLNRCLGEDMIESEDVLWRRPGAPPWSMEPKHSNEHHFPISWSYGLGNCCICSNHSVASYDRMD